MSEPNFGFPPRMAGRVAITHATLVPMDSERLLADHTLLIEDGVIRGIGPSAAVALGEAQVIDAGGLYVLPGLADMHVHYNDPGVAGILIANGITRVRHMWGSPSQLALNQKVRSGEFPGPWIASTSPIIDGLGTHGQTAWPGSVLLTDPGDAEPLVKQYARRGYRQIKAYQWLAPEVLRALGLAAQGAGLRVVGHCPEGMSFEDAMDAGMSCFEHLTGVGRGHLVNGRVFPELRDPLSRRGSPETVGLLAQHLDPEAIKCMADRMAREQAWACPTLVVWQKQVQVPEEALADPALKYESPGMAKGWEMGLRARHAQLPIPVSEWVALARARDVALAGVVRTLHEAGAPLLLGTDAPNPFVVFGFGLHQELDNLVAAGLSPFEAIRCGTVNGARFLGEADEWGTVEVGRRAELLFSRANPLEGIVTLRHPAAILVNGYYFDRAALDRLLEARATQLAAPPTLPDQAPAFEKEPAAHGTTYVERTSGTITGRMRARRQLQPGGTRQVEETAVGRTGSMPYERRTMLLLAPDRSVLRAESSTTSWLGIERTKVERTETGYRAGVEAIDGVRSETTLESEPLPPSERLSATAVALGLNAAPASPVRLLSVDDESVQVVTADVRSESEAAYELRVNRGGTVAAQTYEVDAGGSLLRLSGMTWMQPTELVADTSQ